MPAPARIAVLASGAGSNLQALLDRFNGSRSPRARVVLVVGSRPEIGALERARRADVPTEYVAAGAGEQERLCRVLRRHRADLVVLAGYLRRVGADVVDHFAGRMMNIHPALLPAFGGAGMYGIRVHRAVLASGVRVTGATVHLVEREYDTGAILAQWPVPVLSGDSPESLAARVLAVEHRLLPLAVEALAGGWSAVPSPEPAGFSWADEAAPDGAELRRLLAVPPVRNPA